MLGIDDAIAGGEKLLDDVLDRVIQDPAAKADAKLKLATLTQNGMLQQLMTDAGLVKAGLDNVKAEEQGESWMQRNWRPSLMFSIIAIIVNNYILMPYAAMIFGVHVPMLDFPVWLQDTLRIGLGGYVVGRSGEKIAKSVATIMANK